MLRFDVVIVGAGQAGAQLAQALRQGEFAGSILMIGDEPDLPYDRPPLSKDYLTGTKDRGHLPLRPQAFWDDRQVKIFLGCSVIAVRSAAHEIDLGNGEVVSYGSLVWAAGGAPRRLTCPGADLGGVHVIRTRAHVDVLRAELEDAQSVVIVGGGYVGLEAAAVLSKLGKRVTLVESQDRLLARVAGPDLSKFYETEHRAHGVDLRLSVSIDTFIGQNGRITGVGQADGAEIPAEIAIVGIGLVPNIAVLAGAGAACSNGVDIDEYCRTSLPDVFAIGDCANHANHYAGGARIRLESVHNANEQARVAASALLGKPRPYRSLPWFWSNQYDLQLQTAGLSAGYDLAILRGNPLSRAFTVVYLKKRKVIAMDCVNCPRDFMQGKALIENEVEVNPSVLQDTDRTLREIVDMAATDGARTCRLT